MEDKINVMMENRDVEGLSEAEAEIWHALADADTEEIKPEHYRHLALIYMGREKYRKALKYATSAWRLVEWETKEHAEALALRGELLIVNREEGEGIAQVREGVEIMRSVASDSLKLGLFFLSVAGMLLECEEAREASTLAKDATALLRKFGGKRAEIDAAQNVYRQAQKQVGMGMGSASADEECICGTRRLKLPRHCDSCNMGLCSKDCERYHHSKCREYLKDQSDKIRAREEAAKERQRQTEAVRRKKEKEKQELAELEKVREAAKKAKMEHRECFQCHKKKIEEEFSSKQWKSPKNDRNCRICVDLVAKRRQKEKEAEKERLKEKGAMEERERVAKMERLIAEQKAEKAEKRARERAQKEQQKKEAAERVAEQECAEMP